MQDAEFQLALEQLRECVHTRDDGNIESVLMDLDLITLETGRWPNRFFDDLEKLLGKSWKLFYFINSNWEQVSKGERERLRQPLADAFDICGDWMGAFVIGEILGERYPDEETLAVLVQLANGQHYHWRELVPHALETLAKTTDQETLRGRTILQLQKLKEDKSESVRQEALLSLANLKNKTNYASHSPLL